MAIRKDESAYNPTTKLSLSTKLHTFRQAKNYNHDGVVQSCVVQTLHAHFVTVIMLYLTQRIHHLQYIII